MKGRILSLRDYGVASQLSQYALVLGASALCLALAYFSLSLALALVLGVLAMLYFGQNVERLLYFLVVYLPLEEFLLKWVDYSVYPLVRFGPELVIYAVLAKTIFDRLATKKPLVTTPIDFPLLLLSAAGVLSVIFNDLPILAGLLGLRPLLRYAALYYLIVNSNLSSESLPRLYRLLLAVALLETGMALLQYFGGANAIEFFRPKDVMVGDTIIDARERWQNYDSGQKLFATLGRYNLLGAFLACVFLFLSAKWWEKRSLSLAEKTLLLAGVPVFLLTYSRLSWAGFLGGVVAIFLAKKKFRMVLFASLGALFLLAGQMTQETSVALSEEGNLKHRILGPFTSEYWDMSASSQRLFIIDQVLHGVSTDKLWLGYGPGSMGSLVSNWWQGVSRLSELGDSKKLRILGDVGWLALIGQIGLVGLGLFVWTLAALIRKAIRNLKTQVTDSVRILNLGFLAVAVALIFMNFASQSFEARVHTAYFWILAGLMVRYSDAA